MKLSEIQELIKFVAKSGVSEIDLETKEFKINIKTPPKRHGRFIADETAPAAPVPPPVTTGAVGGAPSPPIHERAPAEAAPEEAPPPAKESKDAAAGNLITIKSPMIGTFYRSSSPDKPPFVSVGDTIKQGDIICIIEAMKLFNEIEAEVAGKIVKVLAENATPVEYEQSLFLVEPA